MVAGPARPSARMRARRWKAMTRRVVLGPQLRKLSGEKGGREGGGRGESRGQVHSVRTGTDSLLNVADDRTVLTLTQAEAVDVVLSVDVDLVGIEVLGVGAREEVAPPASGIHVLRLEVDILIDILNIGVL